MGLMKKKAKPSAPAPGAGPAASPKTAPAGPGNAALASYLPAAMSAPAPARKPSGLSAVASFFGRGKKQPQAPTRAQLLEQAKTSKVANESAEVNDTYGFEVQDWIARKGSAGAAPAVNDETHETFASELDGHLREASGRILDAQTMDERKAESFLPASVEADPFFYDTKKLNQNELDALRRQGLTDSELTAIALYSGQAAYPMNQVLRGLITDPQTIAAYLPWCLHLNRALAKLPNTARNLMKGKDDEGHTRLDASQGDDAQLAITTVYRNDRWSEAFADKVRTMKPGADVTEPGFLSTTIKPGAYNKDPSSPSPVQRTIDVSGSSVGKSVIALSSNKGENEVLFPAGTSMKITSVVDETGKAADPSTFSKDEIQKHSFQIQAKVVGGSSKDAGKPGAAPAADPEAQKAVEEADAAVIGSVLAQAEAAQQKTKP